MLDRQIYDHGPAAPAQDMTIINIPAGKSWTYDTTKQEFCDALNAGTRRFLIDKRVHTTPINQPQSVEKAHQLGACLNRTGSKMAFVLNEQDHAEKVMCLAIMQAGGQVLSTFDMSEAIKWLNGDIA